jgi:hypothetical protein
VTRILLWIEPHPIRGHHDEFFDHAMFLAEALLLLRDEDMDFSLFANASVLARLRAEYPAAAEHLIAPTAEEAAFLDAEAGDWTEARKSAWLDVVAGRGTAGQRHLAMARRVIAATTPDAVILWSDNGALRRAADEAGLPAFSCELGPTRAPFPATFYIDPAGTNGLAAMRTCPLTTIAALGPDRTGRLRAASPIDPGTLSRLRALADAAPRPHWAPDGAFAFVPLQLADDLNTLLHAPYRAPRDFLCAVLPALLRAHGRVVVKGHPGVAGRPGNAVLQDAALDYAASLGSAVHIAPDRLDATEQLWLLSNAALVCSLNSSAAYEALLLDRPVVLLGDAAFDLDATLRRPVDGLADPAPARDRALLRDATLGLFLRGMDAWSVADAIRDALARAPSADSPQAWVASALAGLDTPPATPAPVAAATSAPPAGYVEAIEETGRPGGRVAVSVQGWLHDTRHDRPVRRIAILSGDTVLAETRSAAPRPDVSRALASRTVSLGFALALVCDAADWQRAVLWVEADGSAGHALALVPGRPIALRAAARGHVAPCATSRDGQVQGRVRRRLQRLGLKLALLTGVWRRHHTPPVPAAPGRV